MIKQSVILSIILLILIVLSFSFKKKPKQNLLWEISSPLTKEKSYLFGTIHLIEKEFFHFPDFLKEKINQSTNIIFETPYPNSTNIRSLLLIPNNENIFSYLNENEKNKILKWSTENLKMDENEFLENYGNFKPFVLFQTITQLPFLDNSVSYEQEIYKIVKNSSKKIEGLETLEEQIELLDKIPLDIQKKQLFFAIDSTSKNQTILREMQLAYKQQDLQKIEKWIKIESKTSHFSVDDFIFKRNKKWITKIVSNINTNSTFIAVGAGHLSGEEGIINLLKKEGFKLKSIYIK
jgi:uncharacterized protein YbaP (TraB family)